MCWNNHDNLKILFKDKSKVNVKQYSAIIHQLSYDMPVYM